MQLNLTITDGPSLPADELKEFLDVARRKGVDPASLIADLIRGALKESAKPRKRKEAKA